MSSFSRLKLSHRFAVLIAFITIGFAVYGAWSFKTLNELKINGPLYQRIVQGKDLVADILPPPEYIIESYLVSMQLLEAFDKTEQNQLTERLKTLRAEYDTRHAFWLKEGLEDYLVKMFLKEAHEPAVAFYKSAFGEFIPALLKGERAEAVIAMTRMRQHYEAHRQAVDQVVQFTNKRNADDEAAARARIEWDTVLLLLILIGSLGGAVTVAVLISRSLLASLGGEPDYAARIAHAIADCDLTVDIKTKAGDETSLLAAMKSMRGSLATVIGNVERSIRVLADAALHLQDTAGMVARSTEYQQGMSQSMAAAVGEMASSVTEITSTMEELSASSTQIAEHSGSVADIANQTWEKSKKGSEAMGTVLARMEDIRTDNQHNLEEIVQLGAKSRQIGKVMEIINNIADQTKLIAFNAALEASSAGDAGRRFSVVAGEIRRLADSVTDSTGDIEAKVEEIQGSISRLVITSEKGATTIQTGMQASTSTVRDLDDLVAAASQTRNAARQISISTQQQKTASDQVVIALREIVTASSQTSQAIASVSRISTEMTSMSLELSELIKRFRLTATDASQLPGVQRAG
ncbi:methyl-accepting chemotaxis protein [Rhodoferax ferrireducens]|uniref:methyl-accepting chemotaxis protein n=1 Tax=Rhodoferax ferrireducens TaxID=192843 RepID=UPI000E0D6A96|nr:methyl-accepting chemotaxis protein [Rhodoferax ferrireducens]